MFSFEVFGLVQQVVYKFFNGLIFYFRPVRVLAARDI